MYNKLTELVNNGEWELAEEELNLLNDKWDDELAILKTAIYWQKKIMSRSTNVLQKAWSIIIGIMNYICY